MNTKTRTSVLQSHPAVSAMVKAQRKANRRNMQVARPALSPATRYRIRLWHSAFDEARALRLVDPAKGISKGCDRYLIRLKMLRTVAQGGFADIRDNQMGELLGVSRRTVLRYRAEAVAAGLLEDVGTVGLDHKPCLVRPILPDGMPVYNDNPVTLPVTVVAHEATDDLATDKPPPSPPDDNEQKIIGQALVAPDVDSKSAPPSAPTTRRERKRLCDEEGAARPDPITFNEIWAASDKGGAESAAALAWHRLVYEDRVAVAELIKRTGRLATGTSWVGNWLRLRRWPTLDVPKTKEDVGFRVDSDKPNGVAWRRYWAEHRMRGLPIGRDGYFIRRLPTEEPPATPAPLPQKADPGVIAIQDVPRRDDTWIVGTRGCRSTRSLLLPTEIPPA